MSESRRARHPLLWPLIVLLIAAAAFAALRFVTRGVPVTLTVDGQTATLNAAQPDVAALLADLRLTPRPEDTLAPGGDTPLVAGLAIQLTRARPVLVSADGRLVELFTQAADVAGVLAQAGVRLADADEALLDGQPVAASTLLPPSPLAAVETRGWRRQPWDAAAAVPLHLSVRRSVPIVVDDGSVPFTLFTTASTVGEALVNAEVSLYLGDRVQPGLGVRVAPGLRVFIERSKAVIVRADGHTAQTRTRGQTVGATLLELGILVAGADRVTPALDAPVLENLAIQVTRVAQVTLVESEAIPYESIMVPDDTLEIDQQRLAQEGRDGEYRRRWQVTYEDGVETGRELLDAWTARYPVTRQLAYGRKIVSRILETPEGPLSYWRKVRMYGTSYSPARAGTPRDAPWYGRTRIGLTLKKGMVAVDPKLIPLRSYVYVPNYGKAIAADTGGGVRGKLIDMGYEDHDYVGWHWWTTVYFLDPPPPPEKIMWVLPNYPPPSFGGGRDDPR